MKFPPEHYNAKRFTPIKSAKSFIKENLNVFKEYLKDIPGNADAEAFSEIKKTEKEGLNYKDYHGEKITKLLKEESLNEEEQSEVDIILTDAFFELSDHLLNGKIDPTKLYRTFGIHKDELHRDELPRLPGPAVR